MMYALHSQRSSLPWSMRIKNSHRRFESRQFGLFIPVLFDDTLKLPGNGHRGSLRGSTQLFLQLILWDQSWKQEKDKGLSRWQIVITEITRCSLCRALCYDVFSTRPDFDSARCRFVLNFVSTCTEHLLFRAVICIRCQLMCSKTNETPRVDDVIRVTQSYDIFEKAKNRGIRRSVEGRWKIALNDSDMSDNWVD